MKTTHSTKLLAATIACAVCGCDTQTSRGTAEAPNEPLTPGAPTAAATTGAVDVAPTTGAAPDTDDDLEAEAKFQSVPDKNITGEAEFAQVEGGVRIEIKIKNAPTGIKGIHIHQTDDCSDIANKSMGDHFDPHGHDHGLPPEPQRHLGDLGNITIDEDGDGKLEVTVLGANLRPNDPMSFIGRSVVLHESNDKGTGEAGDAGDPIACAPIRTD